MKAAIGHQLRQAREEQALSLEQISLSTRIRLRYLQAMEAGDFDALPSRAQARGFLRTYAGILGLNGDALLGVLEGEGVPLDNWPPSNGGAAMSGPTKVPASVSGPQEVSGPPETEAVAIFASLGQQLKSQRELLGLSLDDVVRHTHLRKHYLVALEAGDLQSLPSPVQGRGMLSNYASFLGLNPEPLLLQFAEGLQVRLAVRQAARPQDAPKKASARTRRNRLPGPLRRLFSGELLLTIMLVLSLAGFVLWGAIRIFALNSQTVPSPTAPSIADMLLATDVVTPTPEEVPTLTPEAVMASVPEEGEVQPTDAEEVDSPEGTEVSQEEGPVQAGAPVQVYLTVVQRAWMRVLVDGEEEFSGRVLPGSAYSFSGDESVEILTGNGAALQIFFNQQDLGPMGLYGEVVNRIYSPEGVLLPTPTVTPTSAPASRSTQTPDANPELPRGTATTPALP